MPHTVNINAKLLHDLHNHLYAEAEEDIKAGADVNAHFDQGHGLYSSILNDVAYSGNIKAVELLIKHGVNLKGSDGLGDTVLTSLRVSLKTMPPGNQKDNILQVVSLLEKAEPEKSFNGYSMNGLIDSPRASPVSEKPHVNLSDQINTATTGTMNFVPDGSGNLVMTLTAEQAANINKFAFLHPQEAERLFPQDISINLSLEKNQVIISNPDDLQNGMDTNSLRIDEVLKTFSARKQALSQIMNGDLEGAASNIKQAVMHEKLTSIIQSHGIENLRPKETQVNGGQQIRDDVAMQNIGNASKFGNMGMSK